MPRAAFGTGNDARRGEEPDLPLTGVVAAGNLLCDVRACPPPEDEHGPTDHRRGLGVLERRFGPSLSPAFLQDARLPAYAARGTPRMALSG
ncbi:hypothetical protein GCM10010269_52410 [Streptomyces humidus]|uniref:Uncharacterized protein n=1 Tax=Streptomyces humidus TaxID=52259 RepID=A0A918FZW4_9ACTN|nr:hypothetical protein [Streptomyces humidus]GGS06977.1 hypothetical protein GCM10010269_52410 [Streptomyces humidus]